MSNCGDYDRKQCATADNCVYYNTNLKNAKGKNIWKCKDRQREKKKRKVESIKKTTPPKSIIKKISPQQKKAKIDILDKEIKKTLSPPKEIKISDLESLSNEMLIELCKKKGN